MKLTFIACRQISTVQSILLFFFFCQLLHPPLQQSTNLKLCPMLFSKVSFSGSFLSYFVFPFLKQHVQTA